MPEARPSVPPSGGLPVLLACVLLSACATPAASEGAGPTAALLAAEARLSEGDLSGAVDQYLRAATRSDDRELFTRAVAVAEAAGRGADARPLVERWIARHPDDAPAHAFRARLAFAANDLDATQASLAEVARRIGPAEAAGLLRDARPLARLKRVLIAHAAAFPDDRAAAFALADAAFDLEDHARAAAAIARVRALDPAGLDALVLATRIAVARGEGVPALAELDRRAAAPDSRPATRLLAGLLRAAAGDAAGARAALEREVARDPESVDARIALAEVAADAGDLEAAAAALRPAMQQSDRDDVRFQLGRIAERQGAGVEALLWYQEIHDPALTLAGAFGIARVLAATQGLDEARRFIDAAAADAPDLAPRLRAIEAQLLRDAGDVAGALAAIDRGIAAHLARSATPDRALDDDLRYQRAMYAIDGGRLREGVRDLRRLLASTPDDTRALNSLGYALADANRDLGEAERLLAAALADSPDDGAIVDSWGWLKYRRGDLAEARRALERAWTLTRDAEVGAHLGEVLWMQGERDAARAAWDAAAAREAGHPVLRATRARLER